MTAQFKRGDHVTLPSLRPEPFRVAGHQVKVEDFGRQWATRNAEAAS